MRRKEIKAVGAELYARCLALQWRMGVDRVIRYCECHPHGRAGGCWDGSGPWCCLPVRALTGLNEEQIEAVIAHELAHIRGSIAS